MMQTEFNISANLAGYGGMKEVLIVPLKRRQLGYRV
ncbi:MAG: hypothetical protein JWN56_837 [Sphingobacteriales bacterium]|nr:hypothetical protein [Sphingobacteriales bacterium]